MTMDLILKTGSFVLTVTVRVLSKTASVPSAAEPPRKQKRRIRIKGKPDV